MRFRNDARVDQSTGANEPISGQRVDKVLAHDQIENITEQLGISPEQRRFLQAWFRGSSTL